MERRYFLQTISALGGISAAGCVSSEESTPTDTDGDGVPDEHDYAPRDPSVQSKSDIQRTKTPAQDEETRQETVASTTTVITTTPEPTTTSTPTSTSTSAPARVSAGNRIEVDTTAIDGRIHHFVEYSLTEATIQVYAELLDAEYVNGARIGVLLSTYPSAVSSAETLSYAESDVIHDVADSDTRVTTALDFTAPDEPFYLQALLFPADKDISDVSREDIDSLCQTDRLTVSTGELQRSPFMERDTIRHSDYERINVEGSYLLGFSGETLGRRWNASFVASKTGYVNRALIPRSYDIASYVRHGLVEGTADVLGSILDNEAERNGITGQREKVEFLIDFVQNLPYVPDDVSAGVDEYPKYMMETLVEAGGDCEDSSILLASLLLSSSFGYGTVLISPRDIWPWVY
ncbi:hypothetical protein ACFQH6_19820 [Halobacteriaceae archaeon GCM10025711]